MTIDSTIRTAHTAHPISEVLAERWSPRSFDPSVDLTDAQLTTLLEAARWAPSAANSQPRRFIAARRGTAQFDSIVSTLAEGNRPWALRASALIVAIAVTADADGTPYRWAEYDLGQSLAHLTVQAHTDGLHVHQMGGFDPEAISDRFALADNLVPLSVSAIGTLADAEQLDERFRARERADRTRKPLDELVLVQA